MRNSVREWKMMVAAMAVTGLLLSGCSDDKDPPAPPATVTLQGSVVQGPVSGARVFADRAPFNNSWDASEEFTFTAGDGTYSFPAVDGDFRLCTDGGIDTLSNLPAFQMFAPKDADNITPLTTLVALAPSPAVAEQIKAVLKSLAGSTTDVYDLDPTQGIPAPLLTLIKSVEATLQIFAGNFGVTDPADQQALLAEIGTQLVAASVAAPGADPTTVLQTALAGAVASKVVDLQGESYQLPADPAAAVAALTAEITTLVGNIATAVGSGTVTEDAAIQAQVESQIGTCVDNIATLVPVQTVSIRLVSYQVQNAAGADLDSDTDPHSITVPASEAAKVFIEIAGSNTFTGSKSFTAVSLRLQIDDVNSSRLAGFTLSGLEVSVAPGGAITFSDDAAVLTATAVDSAGNAIASQSVNGPFASIAFTGTSVVFDLPALQQLLAAQVAADFGLISKVGVYDVAASVAGAPATGEGYRLIAN